MQNVSTYILPLCCDVWLKFRKWTTETLLRNWIGPESMNYFFLILFSVFCVFYVYFSMNFLCFSCFFLRFSLNCGSRTEILPDKRKPNGWIRCYLSLSNHWTALPYQNEWVALLFVLTIKRRKIVIDWLSKSERNEKKEIRRKNERERESERENSNNKQYENAPNKSAVKSLAYA